MVFDMQTYGFEPTNLCLAFLTLCDARCFAPLHESSRCSFHAFTAFQLFDFKRYIVKDISFTACFTGEAVKDAGYATKNRSRTILYIFCTVLAYSVKHGHA